MNSLWVQNTNVAWVVGDGGVLLYTEDGGNKWLLQNTAVHYQLNGVQTFSSTDGWVIGIGGILLKINCADVVNFQETVTPENDLNIKIFPVPFKDNIQIQIEKTFSQDKLLIRYSI